MMNGIKRRQPFRPKFYILGLLTFLPGSMSFFFDEEKKPSYFRAAVGEAVVFNCPIEFPYDVTIPYILNWKKEGRTIFSSYESNNMAEDSYKGRIKLLSSDPEYGKGSINLTNIRENDGGWYECQVLYPNRSPVVHRNGSWFHLQVDGGNVITIPPINQTALEGEVARFRCSTKENSSTVAWKKDGFLLVDKTHSTSERYSLDIEGSLTISPTSMDDLGKFTCEATDAKGEAQSASAFLNVQYKAKVIDTPEKIYLPRGRSAVIDCHFRSNPPLMKLRWEKDGFLFDPYNVQGVSFRSNGSLYFDEVKEEHGGSYTCTPYNDLGTQGPSPKMDVIVLKQPVFTVIPRMLYIRRPGDTLHLVCDATEEHDVHKPNISWRKDGNELGKSGNLTLENLREEDRGIYQCVASNSVDSISTETEVMIENTAPRAPYQLRLDSTEDSVIVRWKSGLTRPKLKFSVWHRAIESSLWKAAPMLSQETREFTIDDLIPGTEYEIMVLSKDAYGEGMFSKSETIRTKGQADNLKTQERLAKSFFHDGIRGKLVGAPKNVNVRVTAEGSLIITWDPPERGAQGEGVDEYEYEYEYVVEWVENETFSSAVTKDTFYLVRNSIKDRTTYRFSIFAVNKEKISSESSNLVIHIASDSKVKASTLGVALAALALIAAIFFIVFLIHPKMGRRTVSG